MNYLLNWAVPIVCGYLLGVVTRKRATEKALKNAMISLLRSQIVGKVEKYISLGYLPDSIRACLEDLFTQYKALGGNHGVSELVAQAYKLPPTKKEYGGNSDE